jgi:hypothetical protein
LISASPSLTVFCGSLSSIFYHGASCKPDANERQPLSTKAYPHRAAAEGQPAKTELS